MQKLETGRQETEFRRPETGEEFAEFSAANA
jgi:hypothetical protein